MIREIIVDALGVVGFVALVHGVDLVSRPVAWIVLGAGLLVFGILASAPRARRVKA